jgi:hypothetical protein
MYDLHQAFEAFSFLLDLTDAIYIAHVVACPTSAKCHDAIVLSLT